MVYTILTVHLGTHLPDYFWDCIRQARRSNPVAEIRAILDTRIHIDEQQCHSLGLSIDRFDVSLPVSCHLDRQWRDGFWFYCTARFFAIQHILETTRVSYPVFHIEYDNLIFQDLNPLVPRLSMVLGERLGLVADNSTRVVPGIVIIMSSTSFNAYCQFVNQRAHKKENDMVTLGQFLIAYPSMAERLPILPLNPKFNHHVNELGVVFDAAALGQYMFGIDPRNLNKYQQQYAYGEYINPDAEYRYVPEDITWFQGRPYVQGVPVVNLHIHAKCLADVIARFSSNE